MSQSRETAVGEPFVTKQPMDMVVEKNNEEPSTTLRELIDNSPPSLGIIESALFKRLIAMKRKLLSI
jgi:hypothetical protein